MAHGQHVGGILKCGVASASYLCRCSKALLARLGCFTGVPIPQGVDNGGCMTVRVQAYDFGTSRM